MPVVYHPLSSNCFVAVVGFKLFNLLGCSLLNHLSRVWESKLMSQLFVAVFSQVQQRRPSGNPPRPARATPRNKKPKACNAAMDESNSALVESQEDSPPSNRKGMSPGRISRENQGALDHNSNPATNVWLPSLFQGSIKCKDWRQEWLDPRENPPQSSNRPKNSCNLCKSAACRTSSTTNSTSKPPLNL